METLRPCRLRSGPPNGCFRPNPSRLSLRLGMAANGGLQPVSSGSKMVNHGRVEALIRMKKLAIAFFSICIVLASVGAVGLWNPSRGDAYAVFQDVNAVERWEGVSRIEQRYRHTNDVPRYLVLCDKLYLLTQVEQGHLFAVEVEQPHWRSKDITALLELHPELRRYLTGSGWVPESR
jgi:hypothetical protein